MTDTSTADAPPVFTPQGGMQGNLTSSQGQPPQSPLAQPSPLAPPGMQQELQQQQGVGAGMEAAEKKYQAAMVPQREALSAARKDLSATAENVPQQQKLPPAPDAKEYQKNAMAFASAMAVLGAVTSHFGRATGGQALSAFAGALNGWQKGSIEAYEGAAKKWEQDTKATIENNKQLLDKYDRILKNKSLNIDQMMSQISETAVENHHDMMYTASRSNNFTMVAQIRDKIWEYTNGPKGIEAASAPLMADRKKEEAQQALVGERVASGQINPDGPNPKTGQPYSEPEKMYFKYVKEQYLKGFYGTPGGLKGISHGGSAIANDRAQFISEFEEREGRKPTSDEVTKWEGQRSGAVAEGGTIGRRAGNIAIAVQEAKDTIPNVRTLAEKSAGKGLASWNAVENKWKVEKGDKDFAKYVQQINSLINIYGRVISGGGKGTVSDLEHARQMLNPNMPLSGVRGSLEGFETETGIAEAAPEKVRARLRGDKPTAQEPPPQAGGGADGWGKATVVQ